MGKGSPLKLIECGDESDNYAFTLNPEHLEVVTSKCPKGMKVSVVGAFRTGKSFLLTLILRYLRALQEAGQVTGDDWMTAEGETLSEGCANEGHEENLQRSFEWRGGRVRMTTGITVWSEPFVVAGADGEDVAVIVLDTQGLFDNETPMGLTSCIFGLSTLMSSYQIYNVSNRIQEDNLQQLALFTEYGKMAVEAEAAAKKKVELVKSGLEGDLVEDFAEVGDMERKPFQRLEFLVRDWNEFDESMSDEEMEAMMATYLDEVLAERTADDLKFTRQQISDCFDALGCSLLPHPGFAVTKKSYDGALGALEPLFKRCVSKFMDRTFSGLVPKAIGGETLTAVELANYVRAYVGMFADGAKFPQAMTMLEATAEANNRNSLHKATEAYTAFMDAKCGHDAEGGYLTLVELQKTLEEAKKRALAIFERTATMGRKDAVAAAKQSLLKDIEGAAKRFELMNDARNPFKNAELYVGPLLIASASYVLRHVTDAICPEDGSLIAQTCNRWERALEQFYLLIIFILLISFYAKFKGLAKHIKAIIGIPA